MRLQFYYKRAKVKAEEILQPGFLNARSIVAALVAVVVVVHIICRAIDDGNDINVYLFASKQLFKGENIYGSNPYNHYLYSPFFALIMRPLSILNFPLARIIWAILNLILALRIWKIIGRLSAVKVSFGDEINKWWTVCVAFIALGFINDNIILGQITIVILWLTIEGIFQILCKQKFIPGALLLAIGISIKIIPVIGLFYLFFKGKFKAMILCISFVAASLLLPSFFVGASYNTTMLKNWAAIIHPGNDKYIFENDDGICKYPKNRTVIK